MSGLNARQCLPPAKWFLRRQGHGVCIWNAIRSYLQSGFVSLQTVLMTTQCRFRRRLVRVQPEDRITLVHSGLMEVPDRDPSAFFGALASDA